MGGQDISREQKFQQIKELNAQVNKLALELLQPEQSDIKNAESQGLKVFRLMPRETFGRPITVPQEGGSYYSFTTGSHDYQNIAQIGLEQNYLRTGFAGANYGFLFDLGDVPLNSINGEIPMVAFLTAYRPPKTHSEVRKEQSKACKYETEFGVTSNYLKAVVGHTYLLRAIAFDKADVLVALTVIRKDADGSLICVWRSLETFEKPVFVVDKVQN